MRILTFLEFVALIIGGVGWWVSGYFAVPGGSQLALILIGVALALAGAESLYTREMSLLFSADAAPGHAGFPAIVWGLMLFSIGGAMVGYVYLTDAGMWPRAVATLRQYPGSLYLAAGLLLIGLSILLFVDSGNARNWVRTLLLRVPRIIFAAVLLLAGTIAAAGGAWQLLDAESFAASARLARTQIDRALTDHPAQAWMKKCFDATWLKGG